MKMRITMYKRLGLAFLFVSLTLATGCLPTTFPGNYPQREAKAKQLRKIILLTPDIAVHELSAGGVKEHRPAWSSAGTANVEKDIVEHFREKGVAIRVVPVTPKNQAEVEEIRALQKAVMQSIYTHADGNPQNPNMFWDRFRNFDYSLGSLNKLLKKYKGDGLLLVRGQDHISTAGRKALGVIRAINPFDSGMQGGMTWVEAALADRSGDILWYYLRWDAGGFDLRDEQSTRKFVKPMLAAFPGDDQ